MNAHGQLTETEFVEGRFLHIRPRLPFAVVGVLLIVLALIVVIMSRSTDMLVKLIFLAAFFWILVPFLARREFRRNKALSVPVKIELQENGLQFQTERGQFAVTWAQVFKWRLSKSLVLLYLSRRRYKVVPRRFFATEEDFGAFTSALRSGVGDAM